MDPKAKKVRAVVPAATAGLIALAVAMPLAGQEDGGLTFGIDVSTGFRASDNFRLQANSPGETYISDTRLAFELESLTRVQQLALRLDGVLRIIDLPGADLDIGAEQPGVTLTYGRTSPNSRLGLNLAWSERDLDTLDPLEADELNPDDLVNDRGDLARLEADLTIETGLAAPLGFALSLSRDQRDYTNTTDADLFDRRTDRLGLTALARFSAATRGSLSFTHEEYDAEDILQSRRVTRSLEAGLSRSLSPVISVSAALGYTEIESSFGALPFAPTVQDGITGSLEVNRSLPTGQIGASLRSRVTSTGQSTTLQFSRSFVRPSDSLVLALGVTDTEAGGLSATGSLDYARQLRGAEFTAGLSRSVSTSDQAETVSTTRADLGYRMEITDISSLALDLDYARTEDAGTGTATGRERGSLGASYRRSLTRDWDLELGYAYDYSRTGNSSAAKRNSVFVRFDRSFVFRP